MRTDLPILILSGSKDPVALPENGMVNHAYTASAIVSNTGTTDYAEGTLTTKLYFGETIMEEKALPALAAGTSTTVTFNATPRKAGNFAAKIAIEGLATDEHNALVAVADAILDLLPFFGTGTVLVPWAIVTHMYV